MNASMRVHAQKPYSFQSFAHESSKVGGRGKKGGRETGKTEARRQKRRKAAQQNKSLNKELKQGLYTMYFNSRVTLFFANNFLTECRITIEFVYNFFRPLSNF